MHNQDNNDQSLNGQSLNGTPPPWLGAVKVACGVMGILIVLGFGLLVYGLARSSAELASSNSATAIADFTYPEGMTLMNASPSSTGTIALHFTDSDGGQIIVVIDPQAMQIQSQTRLISGKDFGFQ